MANKKLVKCHGCGKTVEIEAETIMAPCPECGMYIKVNKRWEPEGAQYVTPADMDLSKY